jgi:NAD(P)-dependent dehydrogenase (short-subunit alcohol dehydrogenase family)
MDMHLTDKVVLISGAGDGMGFATAGALLEEGARVAGFDLDASKLRELAGDDRVMAIDGDITVDAEVRDWVQAAADHWGSIDGLVNFAAIYPADDGFLSVTDDDWHRVYDVNVVGQARACRAAIPHMLESPGAAIVNVASDAGVMPAVPLLENYSVSKAASRMLTFCIAVEFAPKGIRCNVLRPGSTRTHRVWDRPGAFGDQLAEQMGMEKEAAIAQFVGERIPLGRLASAEDLANAAIFLLSDRSKHVTGAEVGVDGGVLAFV